MGTINSVTSSQQLPLNFNQTKRQEHAIFGNIKYINNIEDQKEYILIQKTFGSQLDYQKCLKKIKNRIKLSKMNKKYLPNNFIIQIIQCRNKQFSQICGKTFKIFMFVKQYDYDLKTLFLQKLNRKQKFKEKEIIQMVLNITNCLIELYDHNIKPFHLSMQSIIFKNNSPKIIDEQISTQLNPIDSFKYRSELRKGLYIAPELLANINYEQNYIVNSSKCDIFTLGILILELIHQVFLDSLYDYNQKRINFNKIQNLIQISQYSQWMKQMLKKMLQADQNERIGLLRLKQTIKTYYNKTYSPPNSQKKLAENNRKQGNQQNNKFIFLGKKNNEQNVNNISINKTIHQQHAHHKKPLQIQTNSTNSTPNYHLLINNKIQCRSKKSISLDSQLSFNTNIFKKDIYSKTFYPPSQTTTTYIKNRKNSTITTSPWNNHQNYYQNKDFNYQYNNAHSNMNKTNNLQPKQQNLNLNNIKTFSFEFNATNQNQYQNIRPPVNQNHLTCNKNYEMYTTPYVNNNSGNNNLYEIHKPITPVISSPKYYNNNKYNNEKQLEQTTLQHDFSDNRSDKPISPITQITKIQSNNHLQLKRPLQNQINKINNFTSPHTPNPTSLQSRKDSLIIIHQNQKKKISKTYSQFIKDFDFNNLQLKSPLIENKNNNYLATNQNYYYNQWCTKQKHPVYENLNFNYSPYQQKKVQQTHNIKQEYETPRIYELQKNKFNIKQVVTSPQSNKLPISSTQKKTKKLQIQNIYSLEKQTPIKSLELLQTIQKKSQLLSSVNNNSQTNNSKKIFGRYDFSNGSVYEGEFNENNQFQGNGILYFPNSKIFYNGYWKSNQFHGFGMLNNVQLNTQTQISKILINYKDFNMNQNHLWTQYQGQFFQDKKHGFGTLYFLNGDKFSGCFFNDSIQGYGNFYQKSQNKTVMGIWNNNIFQQA